MDHGGEGMAVGGRHGCRSRKLTDHIFVCIPEVEREKNWKWVKAINSESLPPPSDVHPPARLHNLPEQHQPTGNQGSNAPTYGAYFSLKPAHLSCSILLVLSS